MKPAILSRFALLGLVMAFVVAVVDQASKLWVLAEMKSSATGQIIVLPFLSLTLERNYSMSFGLLGASSVARLFLAVFPFVAVAAMVYILRKVRTPVLALSLGLIIGGALGNAFDRLRLGWVVDFLDVSKLQFPWVFNVADSSITLGVCLLLYHFYLSQNDKGPLTSKA